MCRKLFFIIFLCVLPMVAANAESTPTPSVTVRVKSKKIKPIELNQIVFPAPPPFLTRSRVRRVVGRVESFLEWDIRKVRVLWYASAEEFSKSSGLGFEALAYTRPNENIIHIGPKVDDKNFDIVLGHELTHVVLYQKYKDAVPKWLEEGLANYVAKKKSVDWSLLKGKTLPDITSLVHPGDGRNLPAMHYAASTAAMQMIASRCRVQDLLQLSVGKKLETYLSTFCRIKEINSEFKKWVEKH